MRDNLSSAMGPRSLHIHKGLFSGCVFLIEGPPECPSPALRIVWPRLWLLALHNRS